MPSVLTRTLERRHTKPEKIMRHPNTHKYGRFVRKYKITANPRNCTRASSSSSFETSAAIPIGVEESGDVVLKPSKSCGFVAQHLRSDYGMVLRDRSTAGCSHQMPNRSDMMPMDSPCLYHRKFLFPAGTVSYVSTKICVRDVGTDPFEVIKEKRRFPAFLTLRRHDNARPHLQPEEGSNSDELPACEDIVSLSSAPVIRRKKHLKKLLRHWFFDSSKQVYPVEDENYFGRFEEVDEDEPPLKHYARSQPRFMNHYHCEAQESAGGDSCPQNFRNAQTPYRDAHPRLHGLSSDWKMVELEAEAARPGTSANYINLRPTFHRRSLDMLAEMRAQNESLKVSSAQLNDSGESVTDPNEMEPVVNAKQKCRSYRPKTKSIFVYAPKKAQETPGRLEVSQHLPVEMRPRVTSSSGRICTSAFMSSQRAHLTPGHFHLRRFIRSSRHHDSRRRRRLGLPKIRRHHYQHRQCTPLEVAPTSVACSTENHTKLKLIQRISSKISNLMRSISFTSVRA